MRSKRTFFVRNAWSKTKLACLIVFIVLLYFLIIKQLDERRTRLYVQQVINNRTCYHNVTLHHPDGTKEQVQRCYPLLINFADGCCQEAQEYNCFTGVLHGAHQCLQISRQIFENDPFFVEKNKNILSRKRGAGYWLWKPYILLRELYLASEGDIIIYSDAAVNVTDNLYHLINLTRSQDIIVFEQAWKESFWTKRDTMIIMDADDPSFYDTYAGVASYIVLRKSIASLRFAAEWLTYAQDRRALTDDPNTLNNKNHDGFRGHRHDQSILGLLAKKWKLKIYPDPSQFGESLNRPFPTVFNHHRQKR